VSNSNSDVASVVYRLRRNGSIVMNASGTFSPLDFPDISRLFGATTYPGAIISLLQFPSVPPHQFFRDLIHEINVAYSYQLYTSTWVCLRKLFENLVIELLRTKFGVSELDLYYKTDEGRFHDFSKLIENLENRANEFRPYTDSFDQRFFDFLKNFKEQANRSAHSVDIFTQSDSFEKIKAEMNHYTSLLCDIIRRLQPPPAATT
jgi:hypothetical protein